MRKLIAKTHNYLVGAYVHAQNTETCACGIFRYQPWNCAGRDGWDIVHFDEPMKLLTSMTSAACDSM